MGMRISFRLDDESARRLRAEARERNTTMTAIIKEAFHKHYERVFGHPFGSDPARSKQGRKRRIRWVTSTGGLPRKLDLSDRSKMWEWIQKDRHDSGF